MTPRNSNRWRLPSFLIGAIALLCPTLAAATPSVKDAAGVEFFEKNIRPVLAEQCYSCHSTSASSIKGDLLLDSKESLLHGGKHGTVIRPGDPEHSRLIEAISYTNPKFHMPPKRSLNEEQIAAFTQWIKMGAPDPRTEDAQAALPPVYDYAKEKNFWSFQPVKDVQPPSVKESAGLQSPIDSFLEANYEAKGLHASGPTDKRTLIRRATYDLVGLPPTPAEVDAFLADASPIAFEKVVDRLLASPHYGEQWGRHWLDVVRYADTSGCNSDYPIPLMYKYRNYVIDAFNNDKAYDEFLREQIAGDLLPAKTDAERKEHTIATGCIATSRRFGSLDNEFYLTIQDTLDNLGKSMLGLSVGCARCHDHKFDPIPTSDYYALYGFFSSTTYSFPGSEIHPHAKDFVPLGTPEQAAAQAAYGKRVAVLDQEIRDLGQDKIHLQAKLKTLKNATTQPTENGRTMEQVDQLLAEDKAEMKKLDTDGLPPGDVAFAVMEGRPVDASIQKKGSPTELGNTVRRGFLQILGGQTLPKTETGSGRLELAQWITDPTNPLTARVMVNRIWEYHFGKGIVATPNDFGHRGIAPTDPALLDYLASTFIKNGWSVKSMHRMLMLSRAYQMSDQIDPANAAIDPENAYLSHFNPQRLSAEEIRDSVLLASGELDPTVDAGPHPFPPSSQWKYTQHHPFVADYSTNQRSIYLMQQRIRKQPFLAVFDGADTNDTTPDRPLSTTAIQALFMMNDPFMHTQADKLASRVSESDADVARQIDCAYKLLYTRPATRDEIALGEKYLTDISEKFKDSGAAAGSIPQAAMASYVRVLLSSNEFIWLD